VPIDRTGKWWRGTGPEDIDEFIAEYSTGGYPARRIVHAKCAVDGGAAFKVRVDPDEGFLERTCPTCNTAEAMLDSADYAKDAAPTSVTCPCGGTVFNVAIGFATRDDGSVKWVYNGLRCIKDGTLGVYGDWKIDEDSADDLFGRV